MVDEHFGTTQQFLILDVFEGNVKVVERRVNAPVCRNGGHDERSMADSIALIADCQFLFTVRAGPPVLARLSARNVEVFQTNESISEALKTVLKLEV
jgi:predicted Fe-Mo cluster-binding NifX family protein